MAATYGRGAMTNHWIDLQHAKAILIAGNNTAECHPIAMKWVLRAKDRGAKIIVVDPRFNRTAAHADIFCQIRPGADIAYLSAIINYILQTKAYDEEYLKRWTNAAYMVSPQFAFENGIFSGFDPDLKRYDMASWAYQLDERGKPIAAEDMNDPGTVFSKMNEHFARYSFELAEQVTGIPAERIKLVADTLIENRPGTILYALGITQHTTGTQAIRCYGIIQGLLGNMGKCGGGVNATRGEANVQGSTDMGAQSMYLPGYIPAPTDAELTLEDYTKKYGTDNRHLLIALAKAWFGERATLENDYCYSYWAKRLAVDPETGMDHNTSWVRIFEALNNDHFKLGLILAQNPAVSTTCLNLAWKGLAKLETLVVIDIFETETAGFWKNPALNSAAIDTEVIVLPAAYGYEKDGSITNSGRWIQWAQKAVEPPGEARADIDIIHELYRRVRALYARSRDGKDRPVLETTWDYRVVNDEEPFPELDAEAVLAEINGRYVTDGRLVRAIGEVPKAKEGEVAVGCWIYGGVMGGPPGAENLSKRRGKEDASGVGLFSEWAYSWPGNIRVLYNRASCDQAGRALDPARKLVEWDEERGEWAGPDTPDVPDRKAPPNTPPGQVAFRMNPEGAARLFTAKFMHPEGKKPAGVPKDGPLPEHYEPYESPVDNLLHPEVSFCPLVQDPVSVSQVQRVGKRKDFPHVLTTYSVTEQFLSGGVSRQLPWLAEMMPGPFAEISPRLAAEVGVQAGEKVVVESARGFIVVPALVTERIKPLTINGQIVETVGVPWNWGYMGLARGDSPNKLTINATDPTAHTWEAKACLVRVRKAR